MLNIYCQRHEIKGEPFMVVENHLDEDDRTSHLKVYWSDERRHDVTVYWDSHFGNPPRAEVNWAAIGSVPPEIADAYAQLIMMAAHWATELQARKGRLSPDDGAWTVHRIVLNAEGRVERDEGGNAPFEPPLPAPLRG